jgi:hypothetical protein
LGPIVGEIVTEKEKSDKFKIKRIFYRILLFLKILSLKDVHIDYCTYTYLDPDNQIMLANGVITDKHSDDGILLAYNVIMPSDGEIMHAEGAWGYNACIHYD